MLGVDTGERVVIMERRWLVPLLSVALVGSLVWGYQQLRGKNGFEIRTQNQYNRAFTELSTHVAGLESQLAKCKVANSSNMLTQFFSDIWREAHMAQEDLGQLPVTSVEMSRTKNFLAKAGAFTYGMTTARDLRQKELTEQERKTLLDLHNQCKLISNQLTALHEEMLEGDNNWRQIDQDDARGLTTAVGDRGQVTRTNKVTKSFHMLEDGLKRLPDPEIEGNTLNFTEKPRGLTGAEISVEQGRQVCRRMVPQSEQMRIRYDGRARGNMATYMYTLTPRDTQDTRQGSAPARIAITVKGGHLAWMLKDRPVAESRLSLAQVEKRAKAFLASRGYPGMTQVATEEYDGVATVSLVCQCDGYVVYPDLVKVQCAMDNGEVLGVEAIPYLTFHRPGRSFPPPKLAEAEVRKGLSPNLQVEQVRQAVVMAAGFEEKPCWEVLGRADGDRFKIFLSSDTGQEEKIQRIDKNGVEIE